LFIKVKYHKLQLIIPGLIHNNFVRGFGWAYKWRGLYQGSYIRGLISGGLYQGAYKWRGLYKGAQKKHFKMSNTIDGLITLFVHGKNSFSTT